jgi:hypothetical protein
MAKSICERSRDYRDRLAARGLVACTAWVPSAHRAEFLALAQALQQNPHLRLAPLRDPTTGKSVPLPLPLAPPNRRPRLVSGGPLRDRDPMSGKFVSLKADQPIDAAAPGGAPAVR